MENIIPPKVHLEGYIDEAGSSILTILGRISEPASDRNELYKNCVTKRDDKHGE